MTKDFDDETQESATVIPLFGRDEMNLVEFPLGPVTPTTRKTFEIDHVVRDRKTGREVTRRLLVTGGDAFGLPRPVDEQVLVGMKALTQEAGFQSRKVFFSRYHLCRTIGWHPDGRAYQRLEESLDRLAGTTLKFKNAWWDKGESVWRSHTFHLIENVELCSRDRYERMMTKTGRKHQPLCYFVWNEVIWKSFEDGFIKSIDMEMFRRIANGKRRDVPLRLYRWLDKRFYRQDRARICVAKLSSGTLGLAGKYPSEFMRPLSRAAKVLVEHGFLGSFYFEEGRTQSGTDVVFEKRKARSNARVRKRGRGNKPIDDTVGQNEGPDEHEVWMSEQSESKLFEAETDALRAGFGSKFQQDWVQAERKKEKRILESGRVRQEYVRSFLEQVGEKHDIACSA